MNAEVIAIGDELTSGESLDTNTQWISQRLGELGICVVRHTTVGDELEPTVDALRLAVGRADLVVCTGGLGPTADDLTRQALAEATGAPLRLDEAVLAHIRGLFARRRRAMPEANIVQAMFPRGSRVLPNPHGTAPGIDMELPRPHRGPSRILALPGVPAEMRQMWREVVEPALLASRAGRSRVIRRRKIHCFGVGESDLEQMLPDLVRRGRRPTVGITVSSATITLRITAEGESAEACEAMIGPAVEIIRQRLGNLVFGEGDDRLQDVVIRSLIRRQKSLATVEWGIGALATNWLSDADDGGAYLGGWVFRDAAAAARLAGLHESLCGEGSEGPGGVVKAAAEACRRRFDAAYGLAVGPFPASGSDPSSVAMLHYALASPNGADAQSCPFTGHPDLLKARSAKQALNFVRLAILDSPPVR